MLSNRLHAFAAIAALAAALTPRDEFLISCAEESADCAPILGAPAPETFDVRFDLAGGSSYTVHVVSAWAPPMAQRFYALALLHYFDGDGVAVGAPFYRVLRTNSSHSFVTQFGYRGVPAVDSAWISSLTVNVTAPVAPASGGNRRGTVAFGTGEITRDASRTPYCTAPECSLGFSVELFVNLADNSAKLDPMAFSPFGYVDEAEMVAVVDPIFSGYGELLDICSQPGVGASDAYCVPDGSGSWKGVNLTHLTSSGGVSYLEQGFPLLDYVAKATLLPSSV